MNEEMKKFLEKWKIGETKKGGIGGYVTVEVFRESPRKFFMRERLGGEYGRYYRVTRDKAIRSVMR